MKFGKRSSYRASLSLACQILLNSNFPKMIQMTEVEPVNANNQTNDQVFPLYNTSVD